ncbi:hypothetical protein BKA57DRAFT_434263 [Linnemannia elongata]|nr:hypothetical protein BKA57DRAFT_434263 [Linnemannia elongata]
MKKNTPIQPHAPGDGNDPNNNHPNRKRDNFLDHLGLPSLKNKWLKHKPFNQLLTAQAHSQPAVSSVTQPSDNITNDSQRETLTDASHYGQTCLRYLPGEPDQARH